MSLQSLMKVVPFCLVTWLTDGYQNKYRAPCHLSGKPGSDRINFDLSPKKKILYLFHAFGRISRNIGENIFRSYTGSTSENTDFHVLVA